MAAGGVVDKIIKLAKRARGTAQFGSSKIPSQPRQAGYDASSPPSLHGLSTPHDPFLWLKENSAETKSYITSENKYFRRIEEELHPLRQSIAKELEPLFPRENDSSSPSSSAPECVGSYLYYYKYRKNSELALYCRKPKNGIGAEEIVVDQDILAKGKSFMHLGNVKMSPNERLVALTLDTTSKETFDMQIREIGSFKLLDSNQGPIFNMEFGTDDWIVYTRVDKLMRPSRVMLRCLKWPKGHEIELFNESNDSFYVDVGKTKDKAFLTISCNSKTTSEVRLLDLRTTGPTSTTPSPNDLKVVRTREPNVEYYVEHRGNYIYIVTNHSETNDQNQNYRLARVHEKQQSLSDSSTWVDIVPANEETTLEDMDVFSSCIVLYEKHQGLSRIRVIRPEEDGLSPRREHVIQPEPVCSIEPGINQDFSASCFRFSYSSPVTPLQHCQYDIDTNSWTTVRSELIKGHDSSDYVVERTLVSSKDGAQVPMTLVHKKKMKHSSVLLTGYAAYGECLEVNFNTKYMAMMNRGWKVALAHCRGGGELGKSWYNGGRFQQKQNSFYDYAACAEHLKRSSDAICASGHSAGGLLVAGTVQMRPGLFKAAVLKVPFVDVYSSMCDASLPLTVHEQDEWGHVLSNPRDAEAVLNYCPYQALLRTGNQTITTNMMITAGMSDRRVPFWGPLRYTAALRASHASRESSPVIALHVDADAGHFSRSGRSSRIADSSLEIAFLEASLSK